MVEGPLVICKPVYGNVGVFGATHTRTGDPGGGVYAVTGIAMFLRVGGTHQGKGLSEGGLMMGFTHPDTGMGYHQRVSYEDLGFSTFEIQGGRMAIDPLTGLFKACNWVHEYLLFGVVHMQWRVWHTGMQDMGMWLSYRP